MPWQAGGVFLVWLVHTRVDWLHLIPGVTGMALCVRGRAGRAVEEPDRGAARPRSAVWSCSPAPGSSSSARFSSAGAALADSYRSDARSSSTRPRPRPSPRRRTRSTLNDEALDTYYVKAAAYARLDDYGRARATLLEAARREPHDFVTWGLLGDLAVRRGELGQAKKAYQQASSLNPRNPGLRELAKDPASAEQ